MYLKWEILRKTPKKSFFQKCMLSPQPQEKWQWQKFFKRAVIKTQRSNVDLKLFVSLKYFNSIAFPKILLSLFEKTVCNLESEKIIFGRSVIVQYSNASVLFYRGSLFIYIFGVCPYTMCTHKQCKYSYVFRKHRPLLKIKNVPYHVRRASASLFYAYFELM